MSRRALAALDPEAAMADDEPAAPPPPVATQLVRRPGLTLSVEVDPPPPHSRWRFFVFWLLVKLAARVYPFRFEIYRTPDPRE